MANKIKAVLISRFQFELPCDWRMIIVYRSQLSNDFSFCFWAKFSRCSMLHKGVALRRPQHDVMETCVSVGRDG